MVILFSAGEITMFRLVTLGLIGFTASRPSLSASSFPFFFVCIYILYWTAP